MAASIRPFATSERLLVIVVSLNSGYCHRGTEYTVANTCFGLLIWITVNVGAALAANNLADRDKFAAKAAPTSNYLCVLCASVARTLSRNNPQCLMNTHLL